MKKAFLLIWCSLMVVSGLAQEPLLKSELSYRRYTTLDGMPQMQVETVWQDSRGYIYIGTLSGFVRYDGLSFTPFLKGRRENIVGFIEVDGQARAMNFRRQWLVDDKQIAKRQIDERGHWLLNNFNATDLPSPMVILEDSLERHRRLCRVTETGMETVMRCGLFDLMEPDRKLYVDTTGIYVPTSKGVFVIGPASGKGQKRIARRLTMKSDVYSFMRSAGVLYAFAKDGIYTISSGKMRLKVAYAFEAPDYGLYVRKSGKGQLLIADSHTIYQYDGRTVRRLVSGFNMIKAIFVDRWDRLWAATYQGAYCFFHRNFVNHRLADANDIVRSMAVRGDGQLVMGTLNGSILRYDRDGTAHAINTMEGNFYQPSAVMLDGKCYMAGNGDVACINGDALSWLHLPKDRYQFVAKKGKLLVTGSRQGLTAYNPESGQCDTITTQILHPWAAAEDAQGQLWVGASTGLYVVNGGMSDSVISDKLGARFSIRKIDYPQKLIITAMEGDNRGNIVFSSADSLFLIRNGKVEDLNRQLPRLAGHEIRAVHLSPRGYLVVAVIDGLFVCRIAFDKQDTHAKHSTATETAAQLSDIQFFDHTNGFTMVEPLKAMMAETADGTIWVAGLEEMTSFKPEDLLSDNQETTVVPAPLRWWQHWWVLTLGALVGALIVWLLARRYEKHRARKALLRLQREKRQKDLQVNAIRLKAIPHFNANVLAGIEYYVMNNSADEATRYLKLYADFNNRVLVDIDRPARTVEEEVDDVRTYLELERLRYGDRLQYDITVDDDVDRNVLLPNMLLHTYCQNAIKHGITHKAEGGHIAVTIRKSSENAGFIEVSVKDDGVGREEASRLNRDTTKQGLKILLEQVELFNQSNEQPISQHVTDLYDDEGKAAGTVFTMLIPLNFKYV